MASATGSPASVTRDTRLADRFTADTTTERDGNRHAPFIATQRAIATNAFRRLRRLPHNRMPGGRMQQRYVVPDCQPNACATVVVCRRCPRRADERADGAGVYRKGWRSSPKLRARRNPNRRKATTDKACQPTLVARFWALRRCNGHHTPIPGVSRSRMRPSRMG